MEEKNFNNSELSVRTINVLRHLGIYNTKDLKEATLPLIGTLLYSNSFIGIEVYYTKRVDKEIRDFLQSSF